MERAPAEHTGKAHTHKTVGVEGNNSATIIRFFSPFIILFTFISVEVNLAERKKGNRKQKIIKGKNKRKMRKK